MAQHPAVSQESSFASLQVRGARLKDYQRIRYRTVEGALQEVLLFDPTWEQDSYRAHDVHLELNADLNAAFEEFTVMQKRILFRVLLQGQSVREAAKDSKRSAKTWERWVFNVALPYLRMRLGDYFKNGKLVLE